MADDRVFPDDFTYGFGGPAPQKPLKFENFCKSKAPPATESSCPNAQFKARRWCIEQVVATRTNGSNARPIHEDAAALYAFLFDIPA